MIDTLVLFDPFISIDGSEISGQGMSVQLVFEVAAQEVGIFGQRGKTRYGAESSFAFEIELVNDPTEVGFLFDIAEEAVPVPFRLRAKKGDAISEANPEYSGEVLITSLPLLQGAHGELSQISVTCVGSGDLVKSVTAGGA
jgi:hypothetical protein